MELKRERPQHYYWNLVEEIDSQGEGLSPWEVDFIESLIKRLDEDPHPRLSDKQRGIIERIYDERVA